MVLLGQHCIETFQRFVVKRATLPKNQAALFSQPADGAGVRRGRSRPETARGSAARGFAKTSGHLSRDLLTGPERQQPARVVCALELTGPERLARARVHPCGRSSARLSASLVNEAAGFGAVFDVFGLNHAAQRLEIGRAHV